MPKSDPPRRRNKEPLPVIAPVVKRKLGPPPDPGRILLAKIMSTLFGALVGIVVANLVVYFFGGREFTDDLQRSKRNVESYNQKLDEDEKQIDEVQKQIKILDNKIKGQTRVGGTANPADKNNLSAYYRQLASLRSIRAEHQNSRDTQQAEIASNEESLTRLNIVSIVAIAVLTMLGYMLYPLSLRYVEQSVNTWVAVYAQAERRSQTLVIGFFAGLIIAVLVLLALFTTFNSGALADPVFRLFFGACFVVAMGTAGSLVAARTRSQAQ